MNEPSQDAFDAQDFFLGSSSTGYSSDFSEELLGHVEQAQMDRPSSLSSNSNYVALGAIRIKKCPSDESASDERWMLGMHGARRIWPRAIIEPLLVKGSIQIEFLDHVKDSNYASYRFLLLPEDINRQYRRSALDCRRPIKVLLPFIDRSLATWNADFDPDSPIDTYTQPSQDHESLFYIFNTLGSPSAKPQPCHQAEDEAHVDSPSSNAASKSISWIEEIPGLKTELYPYQKRSIATMLKREIDPLRSVDPRKPLCWDCLGRPFYFDIQEGIVLHRPHLYEECRGGVLAETMGYGKTLICLGVILSTQGQYPLIPEGRLGIGRKPRQRVGSLLEMAAAGAIHQGVSWKAEFHELELEGYHYDKCTEELRKYVREYVEPIFHPSNPSRKGKREHEKIVTLSSATLIVVPPNLLVQWQHEIEKHTVAGSLDVLVIDHSTKRIPEYRELMKYDVVLITKARLEQEYRDDDLHNGKIKRGEETFQSPLTKMRWLRIICDEGHGFAGSTSRTNALAMIDKMYVERRWVVSGTPSRSMLGVEVDLAADIDRSSRTPDNDTSDVDNRQRRNSIRRALQSRRSVDGASDSEVKDMEKLRLLVVNFLKVRPWANAKGADHANWKKYFAPFDENGERRKAASLRTLLQSLIVRHRIEDIDLDLCLPPLYNRNVFLEPSYYDKLSMNLFVLVLTSNAITSERKDEDYMFHPKNRKQLELLISNLRQSSFHWVGFRSEDVLESLRVSESYLDNHLDTLSDDDGVLLTEALMTGKRALNDRGWQAFSTLHEIGVYIDRFPDHASTAWSIHGQFTRPLLLGTVQARTAQQHVSAHLLDEDPTASLTGAGLRAMQSARIRAAEESKLRTKANAQAFEEPKLKNAQSPSSSRKGVQSPKRKRPSTETTGAKSLVTLDEPLRISTGLKKLSATRIIGFTSAKLTYLVDQVLAYQFNEKIIIFYDANNVAFWIAEALELLSIKFLIYANTLTTARRASYLATFNQDDSFRVLLMDLKQAAHGLHVACASRVYIVTPIWQPHIESQAIKRAHRIGQTKPVHVETLVLKGTLEERMLKRRQEMSDTELQKAKSLLDDFTMAEVIKKERFMKFKSSEGVARFSEAGNGVTWDTPEEEKVVRLANPQPLFGGEKVSDEMEESGEHGNISAACERISTPRSASETVIDADEGDVEVPAAKKQKLTVRILG